MRLNFCYLKTIRFLNSNYHPKIIGDNFEERNSLKLKFHNTQSVLSNFASYESFLESNSIITLTLCEGNVEGSINYKL